jgi:hypothetical protein
MKAFENIDDEIFLEAIRIIIEAKHQSLPAMKISEKHKNGLHESERQIESGEYFSNEEVKKISNEWLKE